MKKTLLLLILFFFISEAQVFAQLDERKVFYLKKIETYKRMRNTGFIMTGIGLLGTIGGIVIINDESNKSQYGYYDEQRLQTGVICFLLGIPLTAGGTVLGLIGTHKVIKYNQKLDNLSLNINYGAYQRGLTLRYKF